MARKYTRKQLRRPDEFITLWHKVWVWVREHATRVGVMVGVAALIIAAVWIVTYIADQRAAKTTMSIKRGLDIYSQELAKDAGKDAPKRPVGETESVPRFKSRDEKLKAAARVFDEVAPAQSEPRGLARFAVLMRASVHFDLGRYDEAIKGYTSYLAGADRESEQTLRESALLGLALSYEAQGNWDKALESLKRLPQEGGRQYAALYHEARILAAKGDKKGAVKLYRQIVDQADSQALSSQASQQLAALGEDARR